MYALVNCRIYTSFDILEKHAVIIDGDKIQQIIEKERLPAGIDIVDLSGMNLSAGFIDLQLNGCGGVQFNDDPKSVSIETLEKMQKTNERSGCTSFLPTLITCSDELMKQGIDVMRAYLSKHKNQALGLHLEGPYLSMARRGTHNPHFVRIPDQEMIDYLCENHEVISQITLAPENVDNQFITQLKRAGIVVSVGHSDANYDQCKQSFLAGVSFSTHLYNGMSVYLLRVPGVSDAVLDTPEIYAGIICDGHHVPWPNVRIAKRLKGEKLVIVTDATAAAGSDVKEYLFAGKMVYVKDGACFDGEGMLSSSIVTMMQSIKNCVTYADVSLYEALRMATLYPARAMKIDSKLGSIEPGKIANLTAFTHDYDVKLTIVNGQKVF